jgi:hypothetical protein
MPGPKHVGCKVCFSGWYAPQKPVLSESNAWLIVGSRRASHQSKQILDIVIVTANGRRLHALYNPRIS